MKNKYDCIIVGGGIAGITAAIYLKNANKDVLLIEKGTMGGILNKISNIKNYPGFTEISGPDLAFNLYEQAKANEIEILLDTVIDIKEEQDGCKVILKDKEFKTKYLILATGKEARKLGLPNEDELIGHGVSYCALCDGNFYKDKDVCVLGAGDSALLESLYLTKICKSVTILNKYPKFKGQEKMLKDLLKHDNVKILYNSLTTSLKEENGKLVGITYEQDGEEHELATSAVFVYIGSTPNILSGLDLELDGKYLKVDEDKKTNLDRIYAVGDVISKDLYQLVGAADDGMIAATEIIKRLNQE